MALLLEFSRQPQRVLTKEALIEAVWEGSYTSDEALSTVIYELRRVLGDRARAPRYLETIRKSGYRLLVTPTPLTSRPVAPAPPTPTHPVPVPSSDVEPAEAPSPISRRFSPLPLLFGLAIAALLFFAWWQPRSDRHREPPGAIESLAVLPLSAYLSENRGLIDTALTDMLVGDIAQACAIDVTPGLALGQETTQWTVDDALESLGVDAVVEGAVARSGDNLWITLQLVDLRTGQMLWSATYDRQLGDELLVLREVTRDAALRIRDELGRRQGSAAGAEAPPAEPEFVPQVSPE